MIVTDTQRDDVCDDPLSEVWVQRIVEGKIETARDVVAEEVPVALEFNGIAHVVMLATPRHIEDFAVGYSLTEGIIDSVGDVYDCETFRVEEGIRVAVEISSGCFVRLKEHRRSMAGRTGCGLCGVDSLSQVRRHLRPLTADCSVGPAALQAALGNMREFQPLFAESGAPHAAFWVHDGGSIGYAREDVGRHNALDKLVGALALSGADRSAGAVLMTSRASFEIVQKAAAAGIGLVGAVSAPTALAIRLARELNVGLIGFLRSSGYVVYHERR